MVITIARQFGSGGREIGRKLSLQTAFCIHFRWELLLQSTEVFR